MSEDGWKPGAPGLPDQPRSSAESCDLKPCPFCGESAGKIRPRSYMGIATYYEVECDDCGARAHGCYNVDEAGAAMEWNTRAPAQSVGMRAALEDIWALTSSFSQYTLEHFARKVRSKVEAALASQPSPVVETCQHAAIIGLDGKWHCQKCAAAIEMATAQSSHNGSSADSEVAKIREEVEKWHRVAMEAGAITCVGGGHIYPLRDDVKKLRAEVERLTAVPQAAPVCAEPVRVSVKPMALSDGSVDYYVVLTVGEREITPYKFKEEWQAQYEADSFRWLLLCAPKPDLLAYGPTDTLAVMRPNRESGK